MATGGKAIITSTPNSDEDQFAYLWKGANKTQDEHGNTTKLGINGFRAFRSDWREHPDRDEQWGLEQLAQLGEDRFRREMECLSGDSLVTVRDKNGIVTTLTITDLKASLSLMT